MKTAIIMASGPSLTIEDVDYCRGKGTVYAVKECHHLAPWADVLYAADTDWWDSFNGVPEFEGRSVTCSHKSSLDYGLEYVEPKSQWHWSTTQGMVATGGNSGFQAMNLAVLEGAERVILLGFDYGHKEDEDKHWWEDQYKRESRDSNYYFWNERLQKAAEFMPVPVLNASVKTSIKCLERVNLRDVL